jgi:hypothetical protein
LVTADLLEVEQQNANIIKTRNWELPIEALDGWEPFTSTLTPGLFDGPLVRPGHGINLNKDIMAMATGSRGSGKSLTISYHLAKKLRLGKPVWTNYPISFYVAERGYLTGKESDIYIQMGPCWWQNIEGSMSYYESLPLDMDKFYRFHQELRRGAVGITELQYFVEARTSIKEQNRLAGYQIMQIRKTANSFFYDVQNPKWVDNRFGWSADYEIECADVAKMRYDVRDLGGRYLDEGEITRWQIKDISGLLTGEPFNKTQKLLGPYQFDGWHFWKIYPTHFIIDAFEAMQSWKRDKEKKDKKDELATAIQAALNDLIDAGVPRIEASQLWAKIKTKTDQEVSPVVLGTVVASLGIEKKWDGKFYWYYITESLKEEGEEE